MNKAIKTIKQQDIISALCTALREAIHESCLECEARRGLNMGECVLENGRCYVQSWREALEKAQVDSEHKQ